MEETKTTKSNSIIEKFKSLKTPYKIALFAGIAVIVILLVVLSSSPKTPFDELKDNPDLPTVEKRYGEANEIKGNTLYYTPYKWLGYDGEFCIDMTRASFNGNSSDWKVDSARWTYKGDAVSSVYEKICNTLNKKYGKGEREKNQGGLVYHIVWTDKYGHKYELHDGTQYGFYLYLQFER